MAIPTIRNPQITRDMLNDPYVQQHLDMQAVTQNLSPTGHVTDNPLEGRLVTTLRELGEFMSDSMVTELLVAMANSDYAKDRTLVAMHKLTPISTVTTLLGDKDASVRYFAERRLAAEEYPDGTY